jgi:hypothetical protein
MAEYRRSLDICQGYDYTKDKQTPVGYITKLQIGAQPLAIDQTVKDPTDATQDLKVVGVMSSVLWESGVTDAIYLSAQVSATNRQDVAPLLMGSHKNIQVVFQFSIYEYDPLAQKYFLAFHSNSTDMDGVIQERGDELNVYIADDPSPEVPSPENYAFEIGINPQSSTQTMELPLRIRRT